MVVWFWWEGRVGLTVWFDPGIIIGGLVWVLGQKEKGGLGLVFILFFWA